MGQRWEQLEDRRLFALIPGLNPTTGTQVTTYTLAMATTAEFTQGAGGPAATATLLNEYVTELNQLYGRELAIQFQLHPRNSELIFTNAATDGYTNGDNTKMIDENTPIINQTLNGSATNDSGYDFGHVLGIGSDGGLAGSGDKGAGASNLFTATVNVSLVGHEIGHQFSAAHNFNGLLSNCRQRNPGTAFEPGSGSTIMSYGGLCGADNLSAISGEPVYFHANSFEEIVSYATQSVPTRGVKTTTGNHLPAVQAGVDRVIPAQTPFRLAATASDADSADVLTYTWEQIDNGGGLTETLLGKALTVAGQPVATTHTLNQLDQTSKPYVPGDRILITGTDVDGRTIQGTYTFAAGHTLNDLLKGGFLDSSVESSFYDANRFLTVRVGVTQRGQILVTSRKEGAATLTLTLQSDPADGQPDSGITAFGAFDLAVDGRSDPGGVSLPIAAQQDQAGPLFRSYPPTNDPSRTFPRLADIVANIPQSTNKDEHLPTQSRDLNFRVTVRDNHLYQGQVVSGIVSDDIRLKVVQTGGPFQVTSHNGANQILDGGSSQTITWDVAGTTANGIDTSQVDILLSLDAGMTYPLKLATQTANDGSETISLPNLNIAQARIMVRADPNQNVFFDLNDAAFQIKLDATVPGLVVSESDGDTRLAEGAFSSTGLAATDSYSLALTQPPASTVQIAIQADSQSQVSLDGIAFASSQTLTFAAGDVTPKTITVRAVDDMVAESAHRGTIRHELVASADPNYSPTKFASGTLPTVSAAIADDEAPPVVGFDFNFADNDPRPTDWTASSNPFTASSTNLRREGGVATRYDLQFTTDPAAGVPASTASTNFQSRSIPRHSPDLTGLDGYGSFEQVTSVTATWRDLDPGKKYRVYVFAPGDKALDQQVAILGSGADDPAPFTQKGTGFLDRLIINQTVGRNTDSLETFGQVVTSAADGTIAIRITPAAGTMLLAGLAIQEVLSASGNPPGKPWQNPTDRLDVSGDGAVVPNDVLRIINELNQPRLRDASGKLPSDRPAGESFYDVNGDGFVTPNDALQVINFLNNRAANPEGESFLTNFGSEQDRLAWCVFWEQWERDQDHELLDPILQLQVSP